MNNLITLAKENLPVDEALLSELKVKVEELKEIKNNLSITPIEEITPTQATILASKEAEFQTIAKAMQTFLEDKKKQAFAPYKEYQQLEKSFKEAIVEVSIKQDLRELGNYLNINVATLTRRTKLIPSVEITLETLGVEVPEKLLPFITLDTKKVIKAIFNQELEVDAIKKEDIQEIKEY